MFVVGDAVGLGQLVQLNPIGGAQLYVVPPDANSVVFLPKQIVVLPVCVMLGKADTCNVLVSVSIRQGLLTITLYVIVPLDPLRVTVALPETPGAIGASHLYLSPTWPFTVMVVISFEQMLSLVSVSVGAVPFTTINFELL